MRIGEFSRRTGIAPDTLRAWERRYGLLRPERSPGGYRLYGQGDEARVLAMRQLIDRGLSAGEAARLAVSTEPASMEAGVAAGAVSLREALERFDDAGAHAILDEALARFTVDAALERVILPCMRAIGERWERGDATVAQEHFASNVVRGRLMAIARNWGAGSGSVALLACPPGEQHDLGLLAFGLALRQRGWRIVYLGPDTPVATIAEAAGEHLPAAIVIAALAPDSIEANLEALRNLAREYDVHIGGGGVSAELSRRVGAAPLEADPVRAAATLAARADAHA